MRFLKATLLLALLLISAPAPSQVVTVWPAPQGAQVSPITASTTATTGAFSATLTGVANRFTYICGFVVTSAGTTTAATVNVTISGTVSGTMNFAYVFVSSGQGLLGVALPGCIVSSAQNTSITVSVPAGGTGTTGALSVWGYTN